MNVAIPWSNLEQGVGHRMLSEKKTGKVECYRLFNASVKFWVKSKMILDSGKVIKNWVQGPDLFHATFEKALNISQLPLVN